MLGVACLKCVVPYALLLPIRNGRSKVDLTARVAVGVQNEVAPLLGADLVGSLVPGWLLMVESALPNMVKTSASLMPPGGQAWKHSRIHGLYCLTAPVMHASESPWRPVSNGRHPGPQLRMQASRAQI